MKSIKMKRSYGFTLAEVLITLAIIGVVAALSIPAVISNSQQQEFKTGLRKAVSVLNSAITMNMALDGESPYDNADTFQYLMKHMNVMRTTRVLPWNAKYISWNGSVFSSGRNGAFYTVDGMRFEVDDSVAEGVINKNLLKLHESNNRACFVTISTEANLSQETIKAGNYVFCGGCGSYGLNDNPNNTTKVPCAILVDVNGDKKPTPTKVYNNASEITNDETYYVPAPEQNRVSDIFVILISDRKAFPYGIVAQKAMYQAQK